MQYSADRHRSIEKAAYLLYVQKGRLDGDDLSDWFQAEKVVHENSLTASGAGVPRRKTAAPKSKKPAAIKMK